MGEQNHPPFNKESAFRWACALGRLAGGHAQPVEVIWSADFKPTLKKSPTLKRLMDGIILECVEKHRGNNAAAARELKCSRSTVVNALKRIGFAVWALLAGVFQVGAQPSLPAASPTSKTNGVVNLTWTHSGNSNDIGYKVWFGATNSVNLSAFSVGNQTNATIGSLGVGSAYKVYVTAYDATGTDGIPSNEIKAVATLPNAGTVAQRIHTMAHDGVGAYGMTNYWQSSTNLKIWVDISGVSPWLGDGRIHTLLRTNTGTEFYRISAR